MQKPTIRWLCSVLLVVLSILYCATARAEDSVAGIESIQRSIQSLSQQVQNGGSFIQWPVNALGQAPGPFPADGFYASNVDASSQYALVLNVYNNVGICGYFLKEDPEGQAGLVRYQNSAELLGQDFALQPSYIALEKMASAIGKLKEYVVSPSGFEKYQANSIYSRYAFPIVTMAGVIAPALGSNTSGSMPTEFITYSYGNENRFGDGFSAGPWQRVMDSGGYNNFFGVSMLQNINQSVEPWVSTIYHKPIGQGIDYGFSATTGSANEFASGRQGKVIMDLSKRPGSGRLMLRATGDAEAVGPVSLDGLYHTMFSVVGGAIFTSETIEAKTFPSVAGKEIGWAVNIYEIIAVMSVSENPPRPPAPDACHNNVPTTGQPATGPILHATSKSSVIDNLALNFTHVVLDYRLDAVGECAPCGSAASADTGIPSLEIKRIFAPSAGRSGSLGWGGFLATDLRVRSDAAGLSLFFPSSSYEVLFKRDANGFAVIDATHMAKAIRSLSTTGTTVVLDAAVTVEVDGYDDRTLTFEMSPIVAGARHGRLTRIAQTNGQASTLLYRWLATDLATDTTGIGKWWAVSKITGPRGDVAMVTTSATPVGDAYPISKIVLPDTRSITYAYGPWATVGGTALTGLTQVTLPSGGIATIAGIARADGDLDLALVDPAEMDPAHQNKTVTLSGPIWIDPCTGVVSPWRVRAVRNGGGEYVYRNLRLFSPDQSEAWTVIDDHGVLCRLVASRIGQILRTDEVSAAVDWATAPSTWSWVTVASYGITSQARLTANTDALGRLATWNVSTATGLPLGKKYVDGSTSSIARDGQGRIIQENDRLGRITRLVRDAAGNPLTVTRASGTAAQSVESATYTANGLVSSRTDALGNVTDYTYDTAGLLLTVTQPADQVGGPRAVTTYVYDSVGRLTSVKDPLLRTTTFTYDTMNRLTKTTYADASTEAVTYGTGANAGRIVSKKDRNGTITSLSYDVAGRLSLTSRTVKRADNSTEVVRESCTYVPGTTREATCTRNGETTLYGYDARARRTSATVYATQAKALTTTYAYDVADRRISETDPYGRLTYFVYDINDRVIRTIRETIVGGIPVGANVPTLGRISATNPPYVIEESTYDTEGQMTLRTDARGIVTVYSYDAQGRLSAQVEAKDTPDEATTRFYSDAVGNQTRIEFPRHITEAGGFATNNTYTNRNLLKTSTEGVGRPEAATTSFTYTLDRKQATITDALNHVTFYQYAACCARVAQMQDPDGFLNAFTYDANGNTTSTTDGNNLTSITTFDALNRPLKRTDPLGKMWTYTYDENLTDGSGLDTAALYAPYLTGLGFGRDIATGFGADGSAVAVKDPNGNQVVSVRDGLGRVVRTINALKQSTTTVYDIAMDDTVLDGQGQVVSVTPLIASSVTDATNNTVTALADARGLVRAQKDALNKLTRLTYDANGNRVSVTDADGVVTSTSFDARNREVSRSGGAPAVSMAYDVANNLIRRSDAIGANDLSTYDGRNRRLTQTDRVLAQTVFTYDLVGNLLTITDAENGVTAYLYNDRNLLTSETFPGATGGTRTYTYDGGRRLKTRIDQTGLVTTYVYDNANRLTQRTYPDAKNDTFVYDVGGRLTSAVSGRYGSTVARTYNKANRVLTEKLTLGGQSWTNTGVYDVVGRLTKLTLPDATVLDRAYSVRGELTSAKLASATVATRTYTSAGRLSNTTYGNARQETRSYDAVSGLVTSITAPTVTALSYTYDSQFRKTAEIDLITPSNTQRFTYDAADRLIAWDRVTGTNGPVQTAQSWNLSPVGDWTATTTDGVLQNRTHTPVHEIASIGGTTLVNDVKGNLTRDQQGQLFTWDVENRLASAASLVQVAGQASATYLYDALGRRVRKIIGQDETTWVSWGAQEVYELKRNPTAIAADLPPSTATTGGTTPITSGTMSAAGSLLTESGATRISFQPSTAPIPAGWLADTGAVYGVRTGGTFYGWVAAALSKTVNRDWLGWTMYDTYNQLWSTWATVGSARPVWELALPNGTYPVVVMCGDARSIQQRNDLLVEGVEWNDPAPWNGSTANPTTGQLGKFCVLSGSVTIADGKLSIQSATTAKNPKVCFIEIGSVGTTFDVEFAARSTAIVSQVHGRTAGGRPAIVRPGTVHSVFGSYVDDLLGYRVQDSVGTYATKTAYYTHTNHLFSLSAVTTSTGAVVERYGYNAYGVRTVKNGAGATIPASAYNQSSGFTSYKLDAETGLYAARARMYSGKLGRFVSRDPLKNSRNGPNANDGYQDGNNLYRAYFAVNFVDPNGTTCGSWVLREREISLTKSDGGGKAKGYEVQFIPDDSSECCCEKIELVQTISNDGFRSYTPHVDTSDENRRAKRYDPTMRPPEYVAPGYPRPNGPLSYLDAPGADAWITKQFHIEVCAICVKTGANLGCVTFDFNNSNGYVNSKAGPIPEGPYPRSIPPGYREYEPLPSQPPGKHWDDAVRDWNM